MRAEHAAKLFRPVLVVQGRAVVDGAPADRAAAALFGDQVLDVRRCCTVPAPTCADGIGQLQRLCADATLRSTWSCGPTAAACTPPPPDQGLVGHPTCFQSSRRTM